MAVNPKWAQEVDALEKTISDLELRLERAVRALDRRVLSNKSEITKMKTGLKDGIREVDKRMKDRMEFLNKKMDKRLKDRIEALSNKLDKRVKDKIDAFTSKILKVKGKKK